MELIIKMAVTVSMKVGMSGILSHKHNQLKTIKVIGIRPIDPVPNTSPLEGI